MIEDKLLEFRREQEKFEKKGDNKNLDLKAKSSPSTSGYFSRLKTYLTNNKISNIIFGTNSINNDKKNIKNQNSINLIKSKNEIKKEKFNQLKTILNNSVETPIRKKGVIANKSSDDDDDEDNNDQETIQHDDIKKIKKLNYFNIFLKFLLWAILFAIFIKLEFGLVYFIVSILIIIFLNTRNYKEKKSSSTNKLSAYSVFNPNLERIGGTLTSEQIEKSLVNMF